MSEAHKIKWILAAITLNVVAFHLAAQWPKASSAVVMLPFALICLVLVIFYVLQLRKVLLLSQESHRSLFTNALYLLLVMQLAVLTSRLAFAPAVSQSAVRTCMSLIFFFVSAAVAATIVLKMEHSRRITQSSK